MSSPSLAALPNLALAPGKPPILRAETSGDVLSWATPHRDALRTALTEHGSILIRGLGLRDAAETDALSTASRPAPHHT